MGAEGPKLKGAVAMTGKSMTKSPTKTVKSVASKPKVKGFPTPVNDGDAAAADETSSTTGDGKPLKKGKAPMSASSRLDKAFAKRGK